MTTQPARLTLSGIDAKAPFHRARLAYMRAARQLHIRGAYQRKEEAFRFSVSNKTQTLCFPSVIDTATASGAAQAALAQDARTFREADLSVRYDAEAGAEYVEVTVCAVTKTGAERHTIGRLSDDVSAVIALLREGIGFRAFVTRAQHGAATIVLSGLAEGLLEWMDVQDDRRARAAEQAEAFCREEARQMREEDIWGDVDGYAVQTWGDYVPTGVLAAGIDGEPL